MDPHRLPGPRPGLIQRIAAGAAALVLVVSAFFLGIIAWILIAGAVLLGALVLSFWVWRQKRRLEKLAVQARREAAQDRPAGAGRERDPSVIEGEFVVLSERRRRRGR